jgi:hypothetical protein
MNANDIRALKQPLLILVAVIAVGAGLLYWTNLTLTHAQRDLAQQEAQLREARGQLQKAGDEKAIVERYLESYSYLQKVGFIGEEQRINWLDGLRLTNQQAQLFGIDYQISAQQPYPYAAELDPGQLKLYQSVMKINLRLLHEGDLLRFLNTLARQGAGVFSIDQCNMDRIATPETTRYQPNLSATCTLSWITVRPEGEKKS